MTGFGDRIYERGIGNCETKNIISVDNYFIFQRSYKLCEVLNKNNY